MSEKYSEHDGIIFASTCENMPNILIESMGCGKPIACSKKLPMPQFLKEGGFYFDALSLNSIISCLENSTKTSKLILNFHDNLYP